MKNTMLFCGAALMSIAMLQSCTKDELSNVNAVSGPQDMTFVAGTPSSRSSLQNGTTVWWTTGDAINIFQAKKITSLLPLQVVAQLQRLQVRLHLTIRIQLFILIMPKLCVLKVS